MSRTLYASLVGLSIATTACPAVAETRAAPVERCTHKSWGFLAFSDYHFATVNTCPYKVHVWYQQRDGKMIDSIVGPGAVFDTGVTEDQFQKGDWSAAICRAPRVPLPSVTLDNWDAILKGQYSCVSK